MSRVDTDTETRLIGIASVVMGDSSTVTPVISPTAPSAPDATSLPPPSPTPSESSVTSLPSAMKTKTTGFKTKIQGIVSELQSSNPDAFDGIGDVVNSILNGKGPIDEILSSNPEQKTRILMRNLLGRIEITDTLLTELPPNTYIRVNGTSSGMLAPAPPSLYFYKESSGDIKIYWNTISIGHEKQYKKLQPNVTDINLILTQIASVIATNRNGIVSRELGIIGDFVKDVNVPNGLQSTMETTLSLLGITERFLSSMKNNTHIKITHILPAATSSITHNIPAYVKYITKENNKFNIANSSSTSSKEVKHIENKPPLLDAGFKLFHFLYTQINETTSTRIGTGRNNKRYTRRRPRQHDI